MIVAIDGPAGAGKSTVARATARALGFTYLDSGAMYRAVGLLTLRAGGPASEQARELEISLGDRVTANGEDVSEAIRSPEVSEAASRVATNPAVRGTGGLEGGTIAAHGDHRLAMLGAVAGLASRSGVEVAGMEAAAVSYPGFAADLARLTG